MSDPTFKNVKLFLLSFKNGANNSTRDSFSTHYVLLVETKYFNVLIDNKPVFNQLMKKNKKRMKNLLKCQEMVTIQRESY